MAEIKIEKKKPVWPWILLLLGIIALVYFLFFRDREAEHDVIEEVDETTYIIKKKDSREFPDPRKVAIVYTEIC